MQFGIPGKRIKNDKYPSTPVIILKEYEDKDKRGTIEFNEKACEIMKLKDNKNEVAFSFIPYALNTAKIINANKFNSGANLKLTKLSTIRNKKHYDEIKELFETKDSKKELLLEIVDNGDKFQDEPVFTLTRLILKEEE